MELTPPVAYRMSLTAAEVEELLLSIYTKIPTDTIRTSLDNPDDLTIPTTKAVADAIAVINSDLEQLGGLALLDQLDLGSSTVVGVLPISKGGTGGGSVELAQQNLGIVVESAIQAMIDASIPAIQSVDLGSAQATGVLPLSKGGTGATGASQARVNLGVWSSGQSETLAENTFAALKRSYEEAGFTLVDGSFEAGGVISSPTEVLLFEADGHAYSWSGSIPGGGKVIPVGSTPVTAGGVGTGLWLDRASVSLRSQLAASNGASLLGIGSDRTQASKNAEWVSITDFPGIVGDSNETGTVGTDCTVALNAALRSGPKSFFVPIGFFRISDTILIPSEVRIYGAHMWYSCLVVDPIMDGAKDAVQNDGFNAISVAYDKNIYFQNFRIKANGFSRTKSNPAVEWGRCFRTGSLKGITIDSMVFHEGPQHCLDLACWKDNYIGVGHSGAVQGMTTDARITNSYLVDYCFDDGFTTHGVSGVTVDGCTSIISDYAKSQHTYVITQNGFEIDDGSYNVDVSNCRAYCNDTESKGFSIANHPDNPIPAGVHFMDCHTYEGVSGITSLGVADLTHIFGSELYRGRNYSFVNCSLNYPHVNLTNVEFPSRGVDIQFGMGVSIKNFRVNMRGPNGETARSPCTVMNIIGCDVDIDGVRVEGVADGQLGSAFGTGRAWFRITDTLSRNIRIKNVDIDNIGWADRVIRDVDKNPGGALIEVDNVQLGSASTDGRTKTLLMSGAHAKFKNLSAPAGVQIYRIGRSLTDRTSLMEGDVEVDYLNLKTLVGGMRIFSETAADNSQPQPGILFDRQFVSSANFLGKGSLAFRTSSATQGSLSVAAYDEDTDTFIPMCVTTYVAGGAPEKAFAPVVHGDMNNGQASSAWLNGYFVNAPQTVSDARHKTDVREMTESEIAAGVEIIKTIGFWSWLSERGDRTHCGTTVQKVISIMESHGLTPFDYSFVCHDKWDDKYMTVYQYDDHGNVIEGSETDVLIKEAGDIYSFKVQELTLYLMGCLAQRLLL